MKIDKKDTLGNRMKEYEAVTSQKLPRRLPVIIRLDGKAFHTYTKGMNRPFDDNLANAMKLTMKRLCEEISGVKLAYTQSDEITLVLTNDDNFETQPWFDNKVNKLLSISSSIATLEFNKHMKPFTEKDAFFDSRVFVVPNIAEVGNNLFWRQLDAMRNSVQMVSQSLYSQSELNEVTVEELKVKLLEEKKVNWNTLEVWKQRGSCCVYKSLDGERNSWVIDENIPIFKEDWNYIYSKVKSV